MDKQKQIEELTSIIDSFHIKTYENAQTVAKFLVEKYDYRKIPENAVVLTNEEYNELCSGISREEVDRVIDIIANDTRKETAEKFAEKAKEVIINMKWARDDTHIKLVTQEDCLRSIDEICKEITEGKV